MNRQGRTYDELPILVDYLKKYKNIQLRGLGTHIAEQESAEEPSALK